MSSTYPRAHDPGGGTGLPPPPPPPPRSNPLLRVINTVVNTITTAINTAVNVAYQQVTGRTPPTAQAGGSGQSSTTGTQQQNSSSSSAPSEDEELRMEERRREAERREAETRWAQQNIQRDISQNTDYALESDNRLNEPAGENILGAFLNFILLDGKPIDEDDDGSISRAFREILNVIGDNVISYVADALNTPVDSHFSPQTITWIHNNLADERLGELDPFSSSDTNILAEEIIEQITAEANYFSIELGDLENKSAQEVLGLYLTELEKARLDSLAHEEMQWQINYWQGLADTFVFEPEFNSETITSTGGFGPSKTPLTMEDELIEALGVYSEEEARTIMTQELFFLNDEFMDIRWQNMGTLQLAREWRNELRQEVPASYEQNADYLYISPSGRDVLADVQTLRILEGKPLVPPADFSVAGELILLAMSAVPLLDQIAAGINVGRSMLAGDWGGALLDALDFLPGPNRGSTRRILGFADEVDDVHDAGRVLSSSDNIHFTNIDNTFGNNLRRETTITLPNDESIRIEINSGHGYSRPHEIPSAPGVNRSTGVFVDFTDTGLSMDQVERAIVDDLRRQL